MGYQENLQTVEQRVFQFNPNGDKFYCHWLDIPLVETGPKGYKIVSASKIESVLSDEIPEATQTKEQLIEKSLRIVFGTLAHSFYTLSSAAVLCGGDWEKTSWEFQRLQTSLRTWKTEKVVEAKKTLDSVGRLRNVYDYERLWELLSSEAFREKPFTDTFPLPWISPYSHDRLPTPEEILASWRSEGLEEIGINFAHACKKLLHLPESSEFMSFNMRGILLEASIITNITTAELKLIIPLRIDELWYRTKRDGIGSFRVPQIIDLKTSIPLNFPSSRINRPQIAAPLYNIAVSQTTFNSWKKGEIKRLFLGKGYFDRAVAENLADLSSLDGYLPPEIIFRVFDGKTGVITDKTLVLPENWREKLFEQLCLAQTKLP